MESAQIHFHWLCGVILGMNVPVSIQPPFLMEQLASCSLNVQREACLLVMLNWTGVEWSGRKHVFISFAFSVR